MKLDTLKMWSDSNRFARRENRGNNMATKGRRYAGRREIWSQEYMDEEIAYIKREMARLELKMRQDKESRWVCEWPMKDAKRKMTIQGVDGQETAEAVDRMAEICKPKTGRSLDDFEYELGSPKDLKDCHEGREEEIPDCHEGNELRSFEDLEDCQEDSEGISHCQSGDDQRSLQDLKGC
jgi:hypothetical protein